MTAIANQPNQTVPDLNLLFQSKKYELKTEINCIAIGTVLLFDSTDQTVSVQVNYLRVIYGGVAQANTENVNNQTQMYPQILKCPVMMLQGGNSYLTFPIVAGDQCVILFNDRDLDTWWTTGSPNSAPNSNRVHDLNDAMVFVGVRPKTNPIVNYNTTGIQMGSTTPITLSVNNVTLGATLNLIMIQLIALAEEVDPSIATTLTALQTVLNGIIS